MKNKDVAVLVSAGSLVFGLMGLIGVVVSPDFTRFSMACWMMVSGHVGLNFSVKTLEVSNEDVAEISKVIKSANETIEKIENKIKKVE